MDEKELVRRCLEGEEEAWRELLEAYDPTIRHLARLALRSMGRPADEAEVEEARSGVLEALLADGSRALRSFRWQCALETWLRVIVRTVCVRAVRRRKIDPKEVPPPAPAGLPLERLLSDERARAVKEALDSLPARERAALSMFFVEGKSYRDISGALGLPMGTVATILSRTRERMRDLLRSKGL